MKDFHGVLPRRGVLRSAAAVVGAGLLGSAAAQEPVGLDVLARKNGRHFGFAVHPDYAQREPVRSLLREHAGVITAENAMKWRNIDGLLGRRDYSQADAIVGLAGDLHALLRGHTLAWHQSTPARLIHAYHEDFRNAQSGFLSDMVLRYKGRIHTWDVLNEVIDAGPSGKDGMRNSVLSTLWGVDRYPALFEQASALDPLAKLAYNDFGMEQDEPWSERRRSAVLRMLERWVVRGVPVHVMGLQAHMDVSRKFSSTRFMRFLDELKALGLGVQITELDIRDPHYLGDVAARDAAIAAMYKDFMDVCMHHASVEMVVMWNVTDKETWVNGWSEGQRRLDGLPQRPTLFDSQGQPKAAFHAVAQSLGSAPIPFK